MIEIVPAILAKDKSEFEDKLSKVGGLVERVQIDIVDGQFVNNKTVDLAEIDRSNFSGKIDVQLMVNEPINWIERATRFGSDLLIGHIEKMGNQVEFVAQTKESGMSAGLALDLGTELEGVDSSLWGQLDALLAMGVKAGFSGQIFEEQTLSIIKKIKAIRDSLNLDFDIIVDGGVDLENAEAIVQAGATSLAIGSAIWEEGDIREKLIQFRKTTARLR